MPQAFVHKRKPGQKKRGRKPKKFRKSARRIAKTLCGSHKRSKGKKLFKEYCRERTLEGYTTDPDGNWRKLYHSLAAMHKADAFVVNGMAHRKLAGAQKVRKK
jgi:hypothetical protein